MLCTVIKKLYMNTGPALGLGRGATT